VRIVHCFNWKLNEIIPNLEKMKHQGFDAVQINPIQPLKEDGKKEWWMSYQPVGFEIGNYFGNKEDLKKLCKECERVGILPISDVVINHMGSDIDDVFKPHFKVSEKLRNNPDYWKNKEKIKDWNNRYEVIHNCIDLPGLNVYNSDVEDMIVDFLNELIDHGVMGFRFDAAKSIGLPSEGYRFWPNLIYRLKKYGLFVYGEVIFEENRNIVDEYCEYMHVLGNYDGSDLSKMIKFAESHDSFLSEGTMGYTKHMGSDEVVDGYCYLTDHYDNTLFYIRPNDDSWQCEKIRKVNHKAKVKKL